MKPLTQAIPRKLELYRVFPNLLEYLLLRRSLLRNKHVADQVYQTLVSGPHLNKQWL